jgi:catechol 2,3-dioxygenase-like lactoylglutathione lyase family enzyme
VQGYDDLFNITRSIKMATENPSIISHISIGTNNFERAVEFYDNVLSTLGCKQIMQHPGAVAYGREFPEFWVQTPINGHVATIGNGSHIGFVANSKEQVHEFHAAALKSGGTDDGAPGPRPDYGEAYYGCFIRDLDGNKIEATFWHEEGT